MTDDALVGIAHDDLTPEMVAYLRHLLLRNRHRTARTMAQNLAQYAGWCHQVSIDPMRATRSQLDDYLSWLATTYRTKQGKPLARTTLSTRIYNCKAWYAWLMIQGLIVVNPAEHLHVRVPKSRVVMREHLTLQEATALVQTQARLAADAEPGSYTHAIQLRNLALICLALATGRRMTGLITVQVQHLDMARQELRVEREKGRMGRVLPVADWCIAAAREYLSEGRAVLMDPSSHWLFGNRDSTGHISSDALRWLLPTLVERTIAANPDLTDLPQKRITWHSLRVSFAMLLFLKSDKVLIGLSLCVISAA